MEELRELVLEPFMEMGRSNGISLRASNGIEEWRKITIT
tara:strand:+ start:197 stop:313 length:117 start_codon:yes stop_codon:yes gene_type:complete